MSLSRQQNSKDTVRAARRSLLNEIGEATSVQSLRSARDSFCWSSRSEATHSSAKHSEARIKRAQVGALCGALLHDSSTLSQLPFAATPVQRAPCDYASALTTTRRGERTAAGECRATERQRRDTRRRHSDRGEPEVRKRERRRAAATFWGAAGADEASGRLTRARATDRQSSSVRPQPV